MAATAQKVKVTAEMHLRATSSCGPALHVLNFFLRPLAACTQPLHPHALSSLLSAPTKYLTSMRLDGSHRPKSQGHSGDAFARHLKLLSSLARAKLFHTSPSGLHTASIPSPAAIFASFCADKVLDAHADRCTIWHLAASARRCTYTCPPKLWASSARAKLSSTSPSIFHAPLPASFTVTITSLIAMSSVGKYLGRSGSSD